MRYLSKRNSRLAISFLIALTTLFFGDRMVTKPPQVSQNKASQAHQIPHLGEGLSYSVVRVIDGDTVIVDVNGQPETLRLIGLDTPETVDPRKPVQCFGVEASNKAKSALSEQKVRIETDPTQGTYDKYGRLLAYIFLPDGMLFNKMMIEEGYGHEYTYHLSYKYQKEFKAAEKQARELKKGLWADGICK